MASLDVRPDRQIDWLEITASRNEPLLNTTRVSYVPGAFEIPHANINSKWAVGVTQLLAGELI